MIVKRMVDLKRDELIRRPMKAMGKDGGVNFEKGIEEGELKIEEKLGQVHDEVRENKKKKREEDIESYGEEKEKRSEREDIEEISEVCSKQIKID